jgi:hypothetical protein
MLLADDLQPHQQAGLQPRLIDRQVQSCGAAAVAESHAVRRHRQREFAGIDLRRRPRTGRIRHLRPGVRGQI